MITKFKIFENLSENKIERNNNYFWWIEGDLDNILNVLDVFLEENKNNIEFFPNFKEGIISTWKEFEKLKGFLPNGVFLFNEELIKFWITSTKDREIVKQQNIEDGCEFKGELKLKNNKLVLDTLEAEIIKYNL